MKTPKRITCGKFVDITNEWLKYHLDLGMTGCQIGNLIGAEESTINKWIQDRNLRQVKPNADGSPIKVIQGKRIRWLGITKEWLYHQHIELNKSTQEIADEHKCTQATIWRWLNKLDIHKSQEQINQRLMGSNNHGWRGGKTQYQKKHLQRSGKPMICDWCGRTNEIQIHHIDHNRENGNLENLTWLCSICNRLEANIWTLRKKNLATYTFDSLGKKLIIEFQDNSLMEV